VIIETDLILAAASRTDRHHEEAAAVIRNVRPLRLSPYAIIELDLLMLSGRFRAECCKAVAASCSLRVGAEKQIRAHVL